MNAGIFVLGFVLAIFGFVSDIIDYHDTFALWFIIAGIILIIVGAVLPSVSTTTTHREVTVPSEKKVRTTVKEE